MDLDIAVTEDRRRGIIARLFGRSRIPPVRFFTVHVDPEYLAFVLGRAQDHFRATPPLRRAASVLHLNRAYREHALGNIDDQGNPRHDVDDGRSHGPAYVDAQTSSVPTLLTYPSPDHVSVDDGDQPDLTTQSNIPTIPSESSGWSPRNRSDHTGQVSTRSLTRSTPIPSGSYSELRGTGLSRPSEPPTGLPAGPLLAPGDPGPSTHDLQVGCAKDDRQQPSSASIDHGNASVARTGQRLEPASSGDTSSHGATASQPLFTDAQATTSTNTDSRSEANDAIPNVVQSPDPGQDGIITYLSVHHFKIEDGPFVDRKMLIRVGSSTQLDGVQARPFDEGLRVLLYVCENHRSGLDQLDLEFFEASVKGGASDGEDALHTVLLSLTPYLGSVHAVSVFFHADGNLQNGTKVSDDTHLIIGAFSRLRFLRLAGHTTVARIRAFPLRKLRVLEALIQVTERDVRMLPVYCRKLTVLLVGPIMPNAGQGCFDERSDPSVCYPSIMRIISACPCEELLAALPPGDAVDLRFTLTDACQAPKIQKFFGVDNGWSLLLE